ncbi:MAG: bifunctional pyrimidine operon regulatory protein/uracil phosphoribosyltransferase [Saprospiraceae bacterium]|nr:MAG: bifunctional pyrimidine operon regulatory protein/uracil phosphoribosyltransferase [Saprospiraceae bacterium]
MEKGRVILNQERFSLTIERLCHELIEVYDDFKDTCLVGIQSGGTPLSARINDRLNEILGDRGMPFGKLDITFYRDDFRTRTQPLAANATEMDFIVEGKKVILVDDVLYTGRTIQAALTALNHYGRPVNVDLLVLIDRRFNRHLPIQSDFTGMRIDALDDAYVKVEWSDVEGEDQVLLFGQKNDVS